MILDLKIKNITDFSIQEITSVNVKQDSENHIISFYLSIEQARYINEKFLNQKNGDFLYSKYVEFFYNCRAIVHSFFTSLASDNKLIDYFSEEELQGAATKDLLSMVVLRDVFNFSVTQLESPGRDQKKQIFLESLSVNKLEAEWLVYSNGTVEYEKDNIPCLSKANAFIAAYHKEAYDTHAAYLSQSVSCWVKTWAGIDMIGYISEKIEIRDYLSIGEIFFAHLKPLKVSFCESLRGSKYQSMYENNMIPEVVFNSNRIFDVLYKLPTASAKNIAISICSILSSLDSTDILEDFNESYITEIQGFCSDFGEVI